MEHNKFCLEGIFDLCQQYRNDIFERKDLKHILNRRKVRFINPEGKFDYAYFGDFYFNSLYRMKLVTKDIKYTKYHESDEMADTLWSTVPVIFAGVQTGYRDDTGRDIYTGDIASVNEEDGKHEFTSVVRYLPFASEPSLICDNFDVMFSMCKHGIHVVGTAYSEMNREMFDFFDSHFVFWPTSQFYMNGMSTEEVIKRAATAKNAPSFLEGCEPIKNRGNRTIYTDINKEMRGEFKLVNFDGNIFDVDGRGSYSLGDFFLYAHRYPETRFILCDFADTLQIDKEEKRKFALLFQPLRHYNITNVVLPSWIAIWLVTEDTLDYMCGGIPNS